MEPRVGIVGGGQLGRMLALAAAPLGVGVTVLDPSPDAGAGVAARQIIGAFDDVEALRLLASGSDVVTFEFENVAASAIESAALDCRLAPPATAMAASQDRVGEKQLFTRLAIETTPYAAVESADSLRSAAAALALPAILKTRRLGYDGKGQMSIDSKSDLDAAWQGVGGSPSILEARVEFDRELSIVAVRSADGETVFYPLTENRHEHGILRETRAPATTEAAVEETARRYAGALLDELGYVGVLALELFETGGRLLANEFAPRVHNSGHWTIEGAETSQFENHIRAITGLPLGSTFAPRPVAMLNLIGEAPAREQILGVEGAHLHLYGKEPRPGRKVGHVTVVAEDSATLDKRLARLRPIVENASQ